MSLWAEDTLISLELSHHLLLNMQLVREAGWDASTGHLPRFQSQQVEWEQLLLPPLRKRDVKVSRQKHRWPGPAHTTFTPVGRKRL